DVLFDGASLVKDYSNQFARLIKKNGVDGLIEKMKKRLKKEEESYAGE
ncbi:ABC transporter substrate-binding protein, partial [Myxococcota bacterium]|nr:ABC transporter substrate-binding protein [Myxococcota bacterium]